jgi:hypothetical protein
MVVVIKKEQARGLWLLTITVAAVASLFPHPSPGQSSHPPDLVLGIGHAKADSALHTLVSSQTKREPGAGITLSPGVLLATARLRSPALVRERAASDSRILPEAPDHRWDGLVIGAVILGASGVFLGSRLCQLSDGVDKHCVRAAVGLGALGAFGGGIIGGLVGGSIPKTQADSTRLPADSTR